MLNFDLKEFVNANPTTVVKRESTRYPGLFVLKYHRRVFYKGLWSPELQELRGMVVNKDYNVIVHPFTKVFNRGEQGTDIPLEEEVIVVEKINGFLGVVTPTVEYGTIYSTTGSLDSDFADMVKQHVPDTTGLSTQYTYLFEICDKSDPHIISEITGAYLIGMRDRTTGKMVDEWYLDVVAAQNDFMRPQWTICKFSDVVDDLKTCDIEGYMVYGKTTSLKLKSPYYLVKKLLARMSSKKFDTDWLMGLQVREILDEEYYPLLDYIVENQQQYRNLTEQDRLRFIEEYLNNGNV